MKLEELEKILNDYSSGWTKLMNKYYEEDNTTTNGGFTWYQILIAFNQNIGKKTSIIEMISQERDSLVLNGIIDVIQVDKGLFDYDEYYFFKREAMSIDHKANDIANEVYQLLGRRLENIELSLGLIENAK